MARLPTGPGVYLFRGEGGAVAYVGKARNLQQRVKSYFQRGRDETRRASLFVDRYVRAIEFVSTATEPEAFLLENRLVKRHKPAYNVKLRDDKDFLYVRIDRRHEFPALGLARRPRGATRGVTHIGPFASASALRHTLRTLGGVVPLRDCSDREFASRTRPCLKYDMGRCLAPCVGWIGTEEYGRLLTLATDALGGRVEPVLEDLERRMREASGAERYEQAARMRDQIRDLRASTGSQQVENTGVPEADAVGLHRAGGLAQVVVLFVRRGALVSSAAHAFESELPDDELLADFLREYYAEGRPVARELLLPFELPDAEGLAAFLGERHQQAVALVAEPSRGARRALVELAAKNARHALAVTVEQRGHQQELLEALAARLGLPRPPETIECYDVSNTGRTGIVASRVAFRHGEPERDRYRHYRIRALADQDDYGALAEVLRRRLARRETDALPDLLIVDGGKGQLGVAVRAVEEAGL
ncbi:MAG TPA: excinuclease ABC subunit UvrC, partial [Planctomycetota bacterium]|nr:excinuclease ABC subunit UvrC [Planctomycetota bacterium]